MPGSLRARLLWAALAGVVFAVAVAAVALAVAPWPRTLDEVLQAELGEEIEDVSTGLRGDVDGQLAVMLSEQNARVYDAMSKDAAFLVLDAQGRERARSIDGPALHTLHALQPGQHRVVLPNDGVPVVLRMDAATVVHGGQPLQIRVARSERLVTTLDAHAVELYARAGAVAALLALVIFAAVVPLIIGRMVRPLQTASAEAARIGPGTLSARLHVEGLPTELTPLVTAFNASLQRLEHGYRVQQEFLASAAHELKTPLALLQAEIELGDMDRATLLRDTALMARQVHQLLHLAEVSERHNYSFVDVDLADVAGETVDYLKRLAGRSGITLLLQDHRSTAPQVRADAAAVFVLLKNLLENAIYHGGRGTDVLVQLADDGLRVRDAGDGVAAQDAVHLFERFWRRQRDGAGAGLGLAICWEICSAHGWDLTLEDAGPPGACFHVQMTH